MADPVLALLPLAAADVADVLTDPFVVLLAAKAGDEPLQLLQAPGSPSRRCSRP